MSRYYEMEETGKKNWSKWLRPTISMFREQCCDCGLVHDLQFRIDKKHGYIEFRARRNAGATRAARKRKKDPPPILTRQV